MNQVYLVWGVNLILCGALGFICLCRANKIHAGVLLRVKLQYTLLPVVLAAYGLQPLLGYYPSWMDVILLSVLLFVFVTDGYQWQNGQPPESTITRPGEL